MAPRVQAAKFVSMGPMPPYPEDARQARVDGRATDNSSAGVFHGTGFSFTTAGVIPFSRTYIKATQAPDNDIGNEVFWRAARHAKGSPAWRYYEIATNHMVANNRPEELARILADIA